MATFFLKISSPSMLASKINNLPLYKLSQKTSYSISNHSTKSYSSYAHAITKSHQNAPSNPIAVAEVEYQALRNRLRADSMPKHVALFLDAHQRSVKERDLLPEIAQICREFGIKVLSVFTISSGNFRSSEEEVNFNLNLTKSDLEELSRNDVRVSVIGNRNAIPESMLEIITEFEETTKNNKSLHIIEAVDYSGHSDIIQACTALSEKVKDGLIQPEDIDDNIFQQELETKCSEFPNPDLMIRTGGEYSVGNFMLWQLAYSELCFVEKNAVDFNKTDFIDALGVYQKRQRRFGGK